MKVSTVKYGSIVIMILVVTNLAGALSKHRLLVYENRCFINQSSDTTINFKLSLQQNAIIFIGGLLLSHNYTCYARCCDTKNCNVVSFYQINQNDETKYNCKMYHCPIISKCVFQMRRDHMLCVAGPLETGSSPSYNSDIGKIRYLGN